MAFNNSSRHFRGAIRSFMQSSSLLQRELDIDLVVSYNRLFGSASIDKLNHTVLFEPLQILRYLFDASVNETGSCTDARWLILSNSLKKVNCPRCEYLSQLVCRLKE